MLKLLESEAILRVFVWLRLFRCEMGSQKKKEKGSSTFTLFHTEACCFKMHSFLKQVSLFQLSYVAHTVT